MKIGTMRRLDRWLGVPVCFLLTLWRRLLSRRRTPRTSPRRILFVKLAEQGSTVLAQGALQAAIRRVGRENVFFLLFAENRPILDLLGLIPPENVIAINARGLWRAVLGSLAAIWKMRRAGIDVAIDLEFFARSSAALCYLSGAPCRVGYHAFGGEASYRGDLMTHRLSFNPYLHTSQAFQSMVEALDRPAEELPTFNWVPRDFPPSVRFQPGTVESAEVEWILREQLGRPRSQRLILLNANCSDLIPLRRWESPRYVELARMLLDRYPDVCIAFTGAPGEGAAAQKLVDDVSSRRCISMAGKTTLRQLLVLCSLAEVLVTNDSGPAHFATLTPIDVVVLFGPETPQLFASRSSRCHPLWAGLACSPCINAFNNRSSPCSNNVCMKEITVQHVFNEVCRWYDRRLIDTRHSSPMANVAG
jgi:ADP-heptose:LPS heptosyltransferase